MLIKSDNQLNKITKKLYFYHNLLNFNALKQKYQISENENGGRYKWEIVHLDVFRHGIRDKPMKGGWQKNWGWL